MHLVKPEEILEIKFKRIYTFAELYGIGKSPFEWAEEIIEKRMQYGIEADQVEKILVDPSMFDPLVDGSAGIKDQFNAAFEELTKKSFVFEKGTKNRVSRWGIMDNWIRTAIDGLPYWIITKDCPNLIRTILIMEPDENNIEDLNTDLEDHGVDSVSYFLPIIKWVDSTLGLAKRPVAKKQEPRFLKKIDLNKFAKAKR